MRRMPLFFIVFALVTFCFLHPAASYGLEKPKAARNAKIWTKDPFQPPRKVKRSVRIARLPKLSAILYSAGRSSAVIDGERVKVGATVAGYGVLDIKKTSVILSYGDRRYELKIGR
jgi:hypothetical protein